MNETDRLTENCDQPGIYEFRLQGHLHDRWTGWDVGHKVAYLWGHRGDLAQAGAHPAKGLFEERLCLTTPVVQDNGDPAKTGDPDRRCGKQVPGPA